MPFRREHFNPVFLNLKKEMHHEVKAIIWKCQQIIKHFCQHELRWPNFHLSESYTVECLFNCPLTWTSAVSRNQGCINYTHFSQLLPIQYNKWRMRQSELRESDGNKGNKKKSWLGYDGPVFPLAFSARLLFLDLSFLWRRLLLLSMASCADGLSTVLGLQLMGYQVKRGRCREGEKKGEREKER